MKNKKLGCLGIIAILFVGGIIVSFLGGIGKTEIPDVIGMTADKAEDTLKEAGFTNIKLQGENGAEVTDPKTWVVTYQSPMEETKAKEDEEMLLTCQSPDMAQAEKTKKKLSKKLDNVSAWVAAEEYGQAEYPYGFDLHSALGVVAEEAVDENTWYLKASCDVTNEYGAEKKMTCEAHVTGTSKSPKVISFVVY